MSVWCELNSNRTGSPDLIRGVGRSDFLFMAGTIAVVAGLLFPLSAYILDVLLIFSVSLTAAVLLITFSAHRALEVSGFPLLIVLATTLRMALSVACAKLILLQGNAGTIVSLFGRLIASSNLMLTILVFGLLATVIFGVVCKAVKGIIQTGTKFTSDIAPIRQINVDSDFNAGVIDESQAINLQTKIAREAGFFIAMGGTAKFMLCDAVIELMVIIVSIAASIAVTTAASTSSDISVKIYMTLAIGAGMVTQTSVLITAVACGYLVRKSSVPAAADDGFSEFRPVGTKRIRVTASEVVCPQTAAPQDDKTITPIDDISTADSRFIESELAETNNPASIVNIKPDEKVITEDLEWFDESQFISSNNKKKDLSLWVWREIKNSSCYEMIAELIENKSADKVKTILMAAESIEELPVTIPVNVAMRLAQKNKKCLLIDLDSERGAISKVFDIDSGALGDNTQVKAIATCISNLWVWPASNFGKADAMKEVIAGLESRYDCLIVYAPNIKSVAERDEVARFIRVAMLFGRDFQTQKRTPGDSGSEDKIENSAISDFYELLTDYGCAILEPDEVSAGAF